MLLKKAFEEEVDDEVSEVMSPFLRMKVKRDWIKMKGQECELNRVKEDTGCKQLRKHE